MSSLAAWLLHTREENRRPWVLPLPLLVPLVQPVCTFGYVPLARLRRWIMRWTFLVTNR